MRILITGAAGFIGQGLILELLRHGVPTELTLTDVQTPPAPDSPPSPASWPPIHRKAADLTNPEALTALLAHRFDVVYLAHGIMSSGSEASLDLGLRVNLDATRALLDHLRVHHQGTRVVFLSSLAVYGPQAPGAVVSELSLANPQSSYGMEKLVVEMLVNDYSRRGLIDGRICRLPTVVVRPGAPSNAAPSFMSGVFREPLQGKAAVLPIADKTMRAWIGSPRFVVTNLRLVAGLPKERFDKYKSRVILLPGTTVTVQDMLDVLEKVGGQEARRLVRDEYDQTITDIVGSWPTDFDVSRARELGLQEDQSLEHSVRDFMERIRKA